MNSVLLLIRTRLRVVQNALRYDTGMKVALAFLLLFNASISYWSFHQLSTSILLWQERGAAVLTQNLWFLCLYTWTGIAVLSVLSLQKALRSDEYLLLFFQPLTSAISFRVISVSFIIENLWNWLLLQILIAGPVFLMNLAYDGAFWFTLLLIGTLALVPIILTITLLFIRYLLPREQTRARLIALILLITSAIPLFWLRKMLISLVPQMRPEYGIVTMLLLLFLFFGPLATPIGRLYAATIQSIQGQDHARKACFIPGMQFLLRLLQRRRDLITALYVKALLNQSRNLFFWLRLVTLFVGVVLFLPVRSWLAGYNIEDRVLVSGYATALSLLSIIETAPNALAGEGNRLTLYLVAPLPVTRILSARLLQFLLPVLLEGLLIGAFLSWSVSFSWQQTLSVLITSPLLIMACTTLLVLGSIWDADLHYSVEGAEQMLLQEEVPITPKRSGLFNLSLGCFALLFFVLWKVALFPALGLLLVFNGGLLFASWCWSSQYLKRLLRGT